MTNSTTSFKPLCEEMNDDIQLLISRFIQENGDFDYRDHMKEITVELVRLGYDKAPIDWNGIGN